MKKFFNKVSSLSAKNQAIFIIIFIILLLSSIPYLSWRSMEPFRNQALSGMIVSKIKITEISGNNETAHIFIQALKNNFIAAGAKIDSTAEGAELFGIISPEGAGNKMMVSLRFNSLKYSFTSSDIDEDGVESIETNAGHISQSVICEISDWYNKMRPRSQNKKITINGVKAVANF